MPPLAWGLDPHAPIAGRRELGDLVAQRAPLVEQLLGAVAAQPGLELSEVLRIGREPGERHLVRAKRALGGLAVDLPGPRPALRRDQHDHRPAGPGVIAPVAGGRLERVDLGDDLVQRGRHRAVHRLGLVSLHEAGRVAVALKQRAQLVAADPRQHGGAGDLVPVQVEHGEHRAVARRVDELVRVPARRQRPCLRLAVPDDAAHHEIGVVERRAERMHERIAELPALVDRPRRLGSDMAGNAAGERELAEQPAHSLLVSPDRRVSLAVGALEVGVGNQPRPAVAGAGDEDRVEVVQPDRPVHVGVDEVETRRGPPVAQQPRFYVLEAQRLAQQRVVQQVDLADGEVVRRAPPGVDSARLVRVERPRHAIVLIRHASR
jgi:hypothetical protein